MGNQKLKWTQKEEDALTSGVKKYRVGKWKKILADLQFGPILKTRSNVDLKDKWRNMHVPSSSRLPRRKEPASPCDVVLPLPATFSEDGSQSDHDVKNGSSYSVLVFEALTTLKETNGSDLDAIVKFIEEKYQVPKDFRRVLLTVTLKTLVSQGKLEKVQNRYKIKKEASSKTKSPSLKRKDVRSRQQSTVPNDAASNVADTDTAACKVADAKNKACELSEAVKELEKLSSMAEKNNAMLKLAEHLYRECARDARFLL